nr:hypothetical protein [uncultured Clostridium sp.]
MGISLREFYINSISVSIKDSDSRKLLSYSNGEINENLFASLKTFLNEAKLFRLEMSNTDTDLSMSIFCENNLSHFGILDVYNDINYYYYDGSGENSLVSIDGQVFEKWMVCEDNSLLWEAVMSFAYNGERSSKVKWKEE